MDDQLCQQVNENTSIYQNVDHQLINPTTKFYYGLQYTEIDYN